MAKREVNKAEAVRDYIKTHPQAKNGEIAAALTKHGITITPNYVSIVKSKSKSKLKAKRGARKSAAAKPVAAVAASPAVTTNGKPTRPGNTVTIEQIKAVGQMVKTVGGFGRFRDMLDVVREVGGLKRLRDLLDAMSLSSTDVTPF